MNLDPRTMYFVMGAAGVTMAFALFVANVRGGHMRAMTLWAAASFSLAVGFGLYALRDAIPAELSVLCALAGVMLGLMLQLASILDFAGKPIPWRTMLLIFALMTAVHAALYYVDPGNARWRIVFAPLATAGWLAACGAALVVTAEGYERSAHWLTAALFFVWGAFEVVRSVYALMVTDPSVTLLGGGTLYSVSLMVIFIGIIGTSLGFILMTKERSDLEIIRVASIDPLTGLWNRRTFDAAAETELQRATRENKPLSVLMIDIDHFKNVNDTYGHPIGDAVLQSFASVLEDALRPFDISSRYGGEEFCVLLINAARDEARAIAERIRNVAAERRVFGGKESVSYTVSVGVAQVPANAERIDATVAAADAAMYRVKETGRNRVEVYTSTAVAS